MSFSEYLFNIIEQPTSESPNRHRKAQSVSFTTVESLHESVSESEKPFDVESNAKDDEDENNGNDEEENDTGDIFLSVFWKRGKLGASVYHCSNAELSLLEDILDINPDFNNLGMLINQIDPHYVVVCEGTPEVFFKRLQCLIGPNHMNETGNNSSPTTPPERLVIVPMSKIDKTLMGCRNIILQQRFDFEPADLPEENRLTFIGNIINLELESMNISLATLFRHLEMYFLTRGQIHLVSVKNISLEQLVSMDENAYASLQIFCAKQHPSPFKRMASGCREGLSIFSLFSRCRTRIGTQRMKTILRTPTRDQNVLKSRMDTIDFLIQPKAAHVFHNLQTKMKKILNVGGILPRLTRTRAKVNCWEKLYESVYNAILICDICQQYASFSELFEKVGQSKTDILTNVVLYIAKIVDFEESSAKNKFTVRLGVDAKLDEMRAKYAEIPQILLKVAELELADLPPTIERCSTMFITELGYLMVAPAWLGDVDIHCYDLPNIKCKFIADSLVYYKTPRCAGEKNAFYSSLKRASQLTITDIQQLDRTLGDIIVQTSQIESEIMVELLEFIKEKATADIINVHNMIAELDCILAMAEVALQHNFKRPEMLEARHLEIIGGRHPLQELCVDTFVPNDCIFDGENGSLKILTGPNASGKSIYLKQVALIVYMAHLGSFVPAASAKIGLIENIHTRIQTVEAISKQMSAFMIDLKQMRHCLYNSTPSTLLIIDEFGKGTTEVDGLALLFSCLKHFIERNELCPLILTSTHYHRLPTLLPRSSLITYEYMDYITENDRVIYLYKIKKGNANSSLASLACRTANLSKKAFTRAQNLLDGKEKLLPNASLKITKNMCKSISGMLHLFADCENIYSHGDGIDKT